MPKNMALLIKKSEVYVLFRNRSFLLYLIQPAFYIQFSVSDFSCLTISHSDSLIFFAKKWKLHVVFTTLMCYMLEIVMMSEIKK